MFSEIFILRDCGKFSFCSGANNNSKQNDYLVSDIIALGYSGSYWKILINIYNISLGPNKVRLSPANNLFMYGLYARVRVRGIHYRYLFIPRIRCGDRLNANFVRVHKTKQKPIFVPSKRNYKFTGFGSLCSFEHDNRTTGQCGVPCKGFDPSRVLNLMKPTHMHVDDIAR